MPRVDVTDEAIIESSPINVYNAILNEISGITQRWMPHLQCKSRNGKLIDCEDDIFDATIRPKSILKARVSCTITKLEEAKSIAIQYAGDFAGTGLYTFESADEGTRIKFRFNVKFNNPLATLLSPFVNIPKGHSEVMQQGFKACNNYLKQS
jgi:hypothetical protein